MIDKFLYARTTEPAHQADIESWPSLEALPHEQRDAMSSSVEAELRLQEGRLLDAMRARDIVTLSRLFDQDYVFTSAGGRVWGPRAGAAGL
ncbi:MAG: hypothetical protein RMJ55_10540 [Roseiflexaceae bacterium]|nr:nuclear transport factor 2 family protein [Roseiflexus sp.]MDW8213985.1 hypothetical protein [Roseiflexaceae bacterium]